MTFPERLSAAISAAEKTQRDLATYLKVQESTVSQWCTGKRLPDLLTAAKVAAYLHVDLNYLVGLTDEPKQTYLSAQAEGSRETREHTEQYQALPPSAVRIRALREQMNLTQAELATFSMSWERLVNEWEAGTAIPMGHQLEILAGVFGVTVDYILGRTDDPKGTQAPVMSEELKAVIREYMAQEISSETLRRLLPMASAMEQKLKREA